ncbi:MAG TPA: hypothetical protein VML96_07760 [Egibacteraceae bacterium]|nr:hypothetical protein [Egibacteraceae bacterium]
MREFVAHHDLNHFPQVADTELVVWERFGIAGQPAWVLIDGQTGAVETISGALGAEELAQRLDALGG